MLWFGLRFPYLGLDVFESHSGDIATQPEVVTENQKIYLANQSARESGIQLGASLATARSICPQLAHYTRNPAAEAQKLEQLVSTAYEFTPSVSQAGEDALLLEVSGSLRLFGGVRQAFREVIKRFQLAGLTTLIGIAHTPRAALVFTRAPANDQWPDYPSNEETHQLSLQQLRQTPLDHLEASSKDRDRLVNMGLHLVGEVLDIPRHELTKRFSMEWVDYLSQLTGELLDPWDAEQPVETFSERLHLIDPIRGKDEILEPMEHLVALLVKWLDQVQLGVRELRWGVYTFEGDGATFEVGFENPRFKLVELMAITKLRMEVVDLPEEAMTVALDATRVESRARNWVAQDILGGRLKRSAPPRELLERLAARLGKQALQHLSILEDHRPEFASAWSKSVNRHVQQPTVTGRGRRPLWLLESPKAINEDQLTIVSGPERIQSGWWDQELQRDYYVARVQSTAWCWCFRDTRGWFLHGYFG